MSARILVLAFLVAAPSAFAMGHWQGEHAEAPDDLSTVRVNAPIITRPGTGAVEAVPRHTEVSDLLARKICRKLSVPEPTHT